MLRTALTHRFRVEEVAEVTLVRLLDRNIRDGEVVRALGRDLTRMLEQLGRHRLLLDLSAVEHLSSEFLHVLLQLHRRAQELGGWVALCGLRAGIAEVFALTGLGRTFGLYADGQQALAALAPAWKRPTRAGGRRGAGGRPQRERR
jgi:anti-anti-sigma factor